MEASALNDFRGKSKTKGHGQIDSQEHGGDPGFESVSLSDDGKSVSLIYKTGEKRCVPILESEPVESGNYPAARTLTPSYGTICPNCKCVKIVIEAKTYYFNLQLGIPCNHYWCPH